MSREERLAEMVRIGMEIRQDDIDLGAQLEQERIIKLLEKKAHDGWISWSDAIALIKGENTDTCEPVDLPCVNGFSCRKHEKSIEDLMPFIKGENK